MGQYLSHSDHSESSSQTAQTTICCWIPLPLLFRSVKLCEFYRFKDLEPSKRGLDQNQIQQTRKYLGEQTRKYLGRCCCYIYKDLVSQAATLSLSSLTRYPSLKQVNQ